MTDSLTDLAAALGGPTWLAERRAAAAEQAMNTPMPSAQQEVWRYSPIDDLDIDRFAVRTGGSAEESSTTALADVERSALVVVRDGVVVRLEIDGDEAAKGLRVGVFGDEPDAPEFLGAAIGEPDAFTLRNDAFGSVGIVVDVARNAVVELPVVVVHDATVDGAVAFPRILVAAGDVVERTVLDVATVRPTSTR